MILKDFLKLENPVDYDFKNESAIEIKVLEKYYQSCKYDEKKCEIRNAIANLEQIQQCGDAQENNIHKMHSYKQYGKCAKRAGARIFDCDCSELVNEIYTLLWGCKPIPGRKKYSPRYGLGFFDEKLNDLGELTPCNKIHFERETINSFSTTYNQAVIIEINKHPDIKLSDYSGNWRWVDTSKLGAEHPDILAAVNADEKLQSFARLTHSIGNFTMLLNPDDGKFTHGFNVGRAAPTMDYWDLSLELMKTSLGGKGSDLFKEYCSAFYIDKYYLSADNAVKPLFARKKQPDSPAPQTRGELDEYLRNVNDIIKKRGQRMVDELKKL